MTITAQEIRIKGTAISGGIAIGRLYPINYTEITIPYFPILKADVENEISRYRYAIKRSREDLERLQKELAKDQIEEGVDILEGHLQIMYDPLIATRVEDEIRSTYQNAEYVFHKNIKECHDRLNSCENPYFQERSKDVEDVSTRILGYLREQEFSYSTDIPPDSIICARDLTPSLVAEANGGRTVALVTQTGGATSHASIVARAKGIPYVSNIDYELLTAKGDATAIVDGIAGELIIHPTDETLNNYRLAQQRLLDNFRTIDKLSHLQAETYDGHRVGLLANLDVDDELDVLHEYGGDGVGLYRSESVFLTHARFPSEDEQFLIYQRIVQKMRGLPIVIRTFDVGGDKWGGIGSFSQELNPYLGCRAIRFLLKDKIIFKAQVRAILRAAVFGKVSIMFPMVSSLSELIEAKELVREVADELKKSGIHYSDPFKIGCMIEVPSAAVIADLLAKECDFLSIGTNDLVQYSLAVDRGNHAMSDFYTPAHPGILRLLRMIIIQANRRGIPVTVCGEAAADPRFMPLLLGLGVHDLSVALRRFPRVKKLIRHTSIVKAAALAEKALTLANAHEIQELLDKHFAEVSSLYDADLL